MYEYTLTFLNKYVEIYTSLTKYPLYGEVIEVTLEGLILQRKYIDKTSNKNYDLFIPMHSIIRINKL